MQNFKVNSHIPVYPLQSFSLKSLRVGNCLSCPMADSGVCTQLPELGGGEVFWVPKISVLGSSTSHSSNTYIYQFHTHDNRVVRSSRKQVSVQESPSSSKILGLCSLC